MKTAPLGRVTAALVKLNGDSADRHNVANELRRVADDLGDRTAAQRIRDRALLIELPSSGLTGADLEVETRRLCEEVQEIAAGSEVHQKGRKPTVIAAPARTGQLSISAPLLKLAVPSGAQMV